MSTSKLIDLIETFADNKFILGDRLIEVGISGPDLESTLSSVAIAQGELGHARLLYNWVFDLNGVTGKKPDITTETGKSFTEVRNIDSWVKLIASLFTVNIVMDLTMTSMMNTENPEVTAQLNKLFREQKEHCIFSEGWALKLLRDSGAVPRKFTEELDKVTEEVRAWLEKIDDSEELRLAGYVSDEKLVPRFNTLINKLKTEGAVSNA
jgi:ring-1,2-phenylacetyl-CoA epoxidase subunit PaaC